MQHFKLAEMFVNILDIEYGFGGHLADVYLSFLLERKGNGCTVKTQAKYASGWRIVGVKYG
jgi:hypothetical protein